MPSLSVEIIINSLFFFCMGLAAFIKPSSVVFFVGLVPSTADARNEIRAVYGGFGIAIAVLLIVAEMTPSIRTGVIIAVSVALLGMAGGRVISLVIEKSGAWPKIFVVMESSLAALLIWGI